MGKNKEQKTSINIGKNNNRNMYSLAHAKFINVLKHKSLLNGLNVVTTEESYNIRQVKKV